MSDSQAVGRRRSGVTLLGWDIRSSLWAIVGWLLAYTAAPAATFAAPTPTAAPALAQSPVAVASATPLPGPTAGSTALATPQALAPTHAPATQPTAVTPAGVLRPTLGPRPAASLAAVVASPSAVRVETPTASPDGQPRVTRGPLDGETLAPAAPDDAAAYATDTVAEPGPDGDDSADSAESEAADDWRAFVPTDSADHLATMDRAARDSGCGVPWHLLAAIARVESDFGRNMATSSAGAVGYGQFLPSSWRAFGNEGNVYDYRDALPAIATYLCASGLARDPRSALFAYNHADWYVDLVLDLAVRYDRMAPGAPTPDVLDVGPATRTGMPLRYAPGRDVKLQARARTIADQAAWLGVPWRGRGSGTSISRAALQTTTLTMLRASFGLTGYLEQTTGAESEGVSDLANQAWAGGLLPLFRKPQVFREPGREAWSLAEVRSSVQRGVPVVALLASALLPGHPPTEALGDQPVVIIGATPGGLIYSDPTFSSSLGYGLELNDEEFLKAWDAAVLPRQALAFAPRPRPLSRDAHQREAEPPPVGARVVATPAPTPPAPALGTAEANLSAPGAQPASASDRASVGDSLKSSDVASAPAADAPSPAAPGTNGGFVGGEGSSGPPDESARPRPGPEWSWAILAIGGPIAAAALWLGRRRSRPTT